MTRLKSHSTRKIIYNQLEKGEKRKRFQQFRTYTYEILTAERRVRNIVKVSTMTASYYRELVEL